MTRPRTPSEVKWVANELAVVAGGIQKLDAQLSELAARRARLLEAHAALEAVSRALGAPGLSAVMSAVRAHRAYGGRGYLVDWLKATLKAISPEALDTLTLARLAEKDLGVVFETEKDRERFRGNSMTRALAKLAAQGLVERAHDHRGGGNQPGRWRWKAAPRLPIVGAAAEGET